MSGPAPFRFLALVVGGWACIRVATLAPDWWVEVGEAASLTPARRATPPAAALLPARLVRDEPASRAAAGGPLSAAAPVTRPPPLALSPAAHRYAGAPYRPPQPAVAMAPASLLQPDPHPAPTLAPAPRVSRWSSSSWLYVRREGGAALAPGGTLGGSQMGTRLLYRLNRDSARPLALSGRLYAPLRRASAGEAAVGIDWRPLPRLPLHILAERRQALGEAGRSAFGLTLYGGGSARLPAGLRLDGYAQTGIVGLRARDLFVDGSLRVTAPVGPVEIGAAAWGAAQPGAARLDAGPQVSFRLPGEGVNLRLSAEWRFRLAGDAAPGSGPALTLATDF